MKPSKGLRGAIKKKIWFFFTFSQKTETPPLPLFWPPQFFLLRIFLTRPRPPPLSAKNGQKTTSFLYKTPIFWQIMPKNLIKPFWMGWDHPPFVKKKSEYFLIRISWIGRDPPLLTESKKKQFFYGSPYVVFNCDLFVMRSARQIQSKQICGRAKIVKSPGLWSTMENKQWNRLMLRIVRPSVFLM